MNNQLLTKAIGASKTLQLITFFAPRIPGKREVSRDLSIIRGRLEFDVALVVSTGKAAGLSGPAVSRLNMTTDAIASLASGIDLLKLAKLKADYTEPRAPRLHSLAYFVKDVHAASAHHKAAKFIREELEQCKKDATSRSTRLTPKTATSISAADHSAIAKTFQSFARNASWLEFLLAWGMPADEAAAVAGALAVRTGSRQGKANLAALRTTLTGVKPALSTTPKTLKEQAEKAPPIAKVAPKYATFIQLDAQATLARADVQEFLEAHPLSDEGEIFGHALSQAARLVEVPSGLTATQAAQAEIGTLLQRLLERKENLEAKARQKREADQQKAFESLKALSPELIKALKINPHWLSNL